ncbi:hypothetical protein [Agreia sp. COWG]|uniref:hypothetical protein n=1 Tax=Agreia sp. COWG TaxID=2773266 RepID=UPI0019263AFA|nr:hypothetical protein [Agreia sp. COWG]CAD6005351.1 protein of unknown function [Agreia sp. COWG]
MEKSRQYIIGAGLFFMMAMGMLLTVEAVWWSIASVVITAVASLAFLMRGLSEHRSTKATDSI